MEDIEEFERSLEEPMPGITREDRYDDLEGESFAQLQSLMGS